MRIGINALYLVPGGVGGTEIYLRSLLAALARIDRSNEYVVFTNRETGPDLVPQAPNFRHQPQPVDGANRPARILHEQFRLPLVGLDVLLNPGFTAPVASRVPQVTVVHDLQHKRHPEHFRWFDLPAWRFLVWAAVHRSRRIVAVSESTRADLLRFYHLHESRVRVIPHGVDESFFGLPRAPEPMVLCVSTLHPHKNIDRLVRVFARFHGRHPDYRLVLAGIRGFHTEAIEREIAQSEAREAVEITGWIPREKLYALFTRAAMFVYPSTFEGFGMPILEAMAADVPTACSDVEPMRSIAGSAALTFDPNDDAAILAAMENLAKGVLPAQPGPQRARQFSWESAARATLDVLGEVA
jgi:glycosyltransferase involved in cell wall biosynthesis